MATYYVGPGGSDSNNGLSWANRKLTLNGAEDIPVAAGDIVHVAPGAYRETLTIDVSGGNTYSTGTVSVTQGSTTITGSSTTFSGNVLANDIFHVRVLASGTDGVAVNASNTFTSAAGNFQAGHVGMTIRIGTIGAYIIATRVSATEITVKKVDNTTPSFGGQTGLTYNIGPETPIEIASVDSNTQLTLIKPWGAPSFTGLAYQTHRPITYIADKTGEKTDGIGGVVRITGSDNDQTTARSNCISASGRSYRTFRGFRFGMSSSSAISSASNPSGWIIEDSLFSNPGVATISYIFLSGSGTANTIRRCIFIGLRVEAINVTHSATVDNNASLIENCNFLGTAGALRITRLGGYTFRNNGVIACGAGAILIATALATGQTTTVNNCFIAISSGTALQAATSPSTNEEITENYNSFFGNGSNYTNVTTGANSDILPPLFDFSLLVAGLKFEDVIGSLASYSPIRAITGLNESNDDMFGIIRPDAAGKKSRGAIQYQPIGRDTGTVRTGTASIKLSDAGRHQIFVPTTAVSTTFSVYVRREADYAGTNPQLVIRQPGVADTTVTDAAAAGQWNLLTTTLTPNANPPYVVAMLVSNNTATSGSYAVYFDDLDVS